MSVRVRSAMNILPVEGDLSIQELRKLVESIAKALEDREIRLAKAVDTGEDTKLIRDETANIDSTARCTEQLVRCYAESRESDKAETFKKVLISLQNIKIATEHKSVVVITYDTPTACKLNMLQEVYLGYRVVTNFNYSRAPFVEYVVFFQGLDFRSKDSKTLLVMSKLYELVDAGKACVEVSNISQILSEISLKVPNPERVPRLLLQHLANTGHGYLRFRLVDLSKDRPKAELLQVLADTCTRIAECRFRKIQELRTAPETALKAYYKTLDYWLEQLDHCFTLMGSYCVCSLKEAKPTPYEVQCVAHTVLQHVQEPGTWVVKLLDDPKTTFHKVEDLDYAELTFKVYNESARYKDVDTSKACAEAKQWLDKPLKHK